MERLLLASSLALAGILAGCKTGYLEPSGKPVRDDSGNVVKVSSSTKKKIANVMPAIRREIRAEISKAVKSGSLVEAASYQMPVTRIRFLLGTDASQEEVEAMKALADAEARIYRTDFVYPAQVDLTKKILDADMGTFLSAAKFEQASELLAGVKKTGIAEIDDDVFAYAEKLNKSKVAPAWAMAIIEKARPSVMECMAKGRHEQAKEILRRIPATGNADVDALVREFAEDMTRIDGKQAGRPAGGGNAIKN